MNFQDLIKKMSSLEQPVSEEKVEEAAIDECGMMGGMSGPMEPPKQSDSVTMNVSMNGSGAGGIKDLMQILRNIDTGGDPENFGDKDMDVIVKKMASPEPDAMKLIGDEFQNEPDEMYQGVDAVTGTGNDIHSKGIEKRAVAGGGNPMNAESIKQKLTTMYEELRGEPFSKPLQESVKTETPKAVLQESIDIKKLAGI